MQMQDVPVALGSSGKTIKSKANDRVFVYFRWYPAVMCMDLPEAFLCISVAHPQELHVQDLYSHAFSDMLIHLGAATMGRLVY